MAVEQIGDAGRALLEAAIAKARYAVEVSDVPHAQCTDPPDDRVSFTPLSSISPNGARMRAVARRRSSAERSAPRKS